MSFRNAVLALALLGILSWGIVATALTWVERAIPPSRATPTPAVPHCVAFASHHRGDSVVYEVWRRRGERCRLTLPDGTRHRVVPHEP